MFKWIGWDKPRTLISLSIMALLITGIIVYLVSKSPKPVFDFDDGTPQGWTVRGFFDDTGKRYGPKPPARIAIPTHDEKEQYPNPFPCGGIGPTSTCDDMHNKKGSLYVDLEGVLSLKDLFDFPSSSSYWEVELVSPPLSNLFQNKSEFEAHMGDMLSVPKGFIRAAILLQISSNGSTIKITPQGGAIDKVLSKTSWETLTAKFTIPKGAYIQNIIIRVRGEWKKPHAYAGGLFLDHVAAVK